MLTFSRFLNMPGGTETTVFDRHMIYVTCSLEALRISCYIFHVKSIQGIAIMPVIRVNDATFVDLKSVATWLGTETPSQTIDRLVREKMEQLGLERDDAPEEMMPRDVSSTASDEGDMEFRSAPGLSFTRVLDASVGGKTLGKANWSGVLLNVITATKKKNGMDAKTLCHELQIPSKPYEYVSEGYKYQSELGISIQGQSAQDAWKEIQRLADKHHVAVDVRFQWRENDKAQYPGRIGVLRAGK